MWQLSFIHLQKHVTCRQLKSCAIMHCSVGMIWGSIKSCVPVPTKNINCSSYQYKQSTILMLTKLSYTQKMGIYGTEFRKSLLNCCFNIGLQKCWVHVYLCTALTRLDLLPNVSCFVHLQLACLIWSELIARATAFIVLRSISLLDDAAQITNSRETFLQFNNNRQFLPEIIIHRLEEKLVVWSV